MKILFYIIAALIYAVITAILKMNGILLGGIPTVILCGALWVAANAASRAWASKHPPKNDKENLHRKMPVKITEHSIQDNNSNSGSDNGNNMSHDISDNSSSKKTSHISAIPPTGKARILSAKASTIQPANNTYDNKRIPLAHRISKITLILCIIFFIVSIVSITINIAGYRYYGDKLSNSESDYYSIVKDLKSVKNNLSIANRQIRNLQEQLSDRTDFLYFISWYSSSSGREIIDDHLTSSGIEKTNLTFDQYLELAAGLYEKHRIEWIAQIAETIIYSNTLTFVEWKKLKNEYEVIERCAESEASLRERGETPSQSLYNTAIEHFDRIMGIAAEIKSN